MHLKCSNSKFNEQNRKSKASRMASSAIVVGTRRHASARVGAVPSPSGQVARSREPSDTVLTGTQGVDAMKKMICAGALGAMVLAGCVGTPNLSGSLGAPSFTALQSMCSSGAADYGMDAQSVYSAFFDAYVAQKGGKLSKDQYCAFQAGIASQHAAYASAGTPQAQSAWATFFNQQRALAISWRATVDSTLRAG
jgi:hypothetical protein